MLLRAAMLTDDRFAMSSLAILARSASQILARYHDWYTTQTYNLAWQHLRHITTCAHVSMICYWRQELLQRETETNLASAIWILSLAEPRWTTFAQSAREKIELVAHALGKLYTREQGMGAKVARTEPDAVGTAPSARPAGPSAPSDDRSVSRQRAFSRQSIWRCLVFHARRRIQRVRL